MDYLKVNKIFCQPLLNSAFSIPQLSKVEEDFIWNQCKNHLYSGFLSKNTVFSNANANLQKNLQRLSRNYQYKLFSMYEEMYKINEKFKKNGIKAIFMKGMALNLAEIHQHDQRHCRDIDILVERNMLEKAYTILKSLGFSYIDNECEDCASYLAPMHHLPPLSNEKSIVVELHHRVTSPQAYKECPLTHKFLDNFQVIKGINIPSKQNLVLHAVYHGVVHNSLGDGLICLIDLKRIINKYDISLDLESAEKLLNIERKKLLQIDEILLMISKKNIELEKVLYKIESFFETNVLFCEKRKKRISQNISITERFNIIQYQYQIHFFSIKFFSIALKKLITLVKRNYL